MPPPDKNTSVFPHGHIDRSTWKRVRLGDVGYTYNGLSGKTKQDFDAGDAFYIPFLNVLENTEIDINNLGRVNVSALEKQTCVQKNDLFFNTSSETPEEVGMCAYLSQELSNTFLNSFCFGFRLYNIHVAEPRFLVYLFNSAYGRRVISSLAQGVTRYNLSKERLLQSDIHLPPVTEQLRIASCINIVEKNLVDMQTLISKYDAIKKATVNLLLKPTGTHMVKLGEVADISRGGSPRPIQDYITADIDGINWIKIGDVSVDAKYIKQTEERIKPTGVAMSRQVKAGDFILSNSMSFGRPYILKIDGCIHDGWLAIQNYQNTFDVDYLYYLLGSDMVFAQYIENAAGSSVKNLNKDIVAKIRLPAPSLSEQCKIAEQITAIDNALADYKAQLEKARQLKAGMMSYFFG